MYWTLHMVHLDQIRWTTMDLHWMPQREVKPGCLLLCFFFVECATSSVCCIDNEVIKAQNRNEPPPEVIFLFQQRKHVISLQH